jgi:hypothetical protein
MAIEVVAIRRDGFDGDIDIALENLPEGVTAQGLKIAAGQSRGLLLVTADQNAPRGLTNAKFTGRAKINGADVVRPCQLASHAWPIPDSWGEIPRPRLMADVPVSVSGFDFAPITIAPADRKPIEAAVGEKVTIPLVHTKRSEFSGATLQLRTMGAGFDRNAMFDVSLTADGSQAVLDLAALKPAPGDYLIAFYGSAVAKYRHRLDDVTAAEDAVRKAEADLKAIAAEAAQAAEGVAERQKAAEAALAAAKERLKQATAVAQPRDIVDIVVSEPIAIRVKPAESK